MSILGNTPQPPPDRMPAVYGGCGTAFVVIVILAIIGVPTWGGIGAYVASAITLAAISGSYGYIRKRQMAKWTEAEKERTQAD
jgi:O-antigen/teichoic acid export membrane protein